MDPAVEAVVRELRAARKYRHVGDDTVRRIAAWAVGRFPEKEAAKAAKRKLHQVFAAFLEAGDLDRLRDRVEAVPPAGDPGFRDGCLGLLAGHASTAERVPILDRLYPMLWAVTGRPRVLLDLACGYHPFAWPWFGLDAGAEYHPSDIDVRLIDAANLFLSNVGRPPRAECRDLLAGMPTVRADVALLFKTLPTVEQQEKGIGPGLVRSIPARFVVVSFPLRSLGGRGKGMRETYDRRMAEVVAALGCRSERLELPGEAFYILETGGPL